jgi:hypothetical protein
MRIGCAGPSARERSLASRLRSLAAMRSHLLHSPIRRGALVVALALSIATTACAAPYADLSCASTSTPVMLGPVDRIDGHRRGERATIATIDVESSSSLVNGRSYFRWRRTPEDLASSAVDTATQRRADLDVRLTRIETGAWLLMPIVAARNERWIRIHGDTVSAFK